jgi:peptidoglycan hydrolase-like protein with peptidoglycan-binding domain
MAVGSQGDDVRALQNTLRALNLLSAAATGYYGPLTQKAVAAYQKAHGLPPVGSVGPLTLGLLNASSAVPTLASAQTPAPAAQVIPASAPLAPSLAFPRDLSIGSEGADVYRLQAFLNKNGYVVSADGPGSPGQETTHFGAKTSFALALFEEDHSIIPSSGILSGTTRVLANSVFK